ncbi:pimeloyl-ACP methyl ester carboxylesterase [Nocardioides sp. BE266]|uniref:alpha/beta fold hydrolase n=1 Tax=Nocardioides sp. BE266 TaxID=2817725 RepID=UPI00285B38A1|nr:alpha/beta hydrolase [Nocardioides sp. BE266]MDR7254231.1 pimeloyl-ACP methyl ester carboxylesterase [Nocardioides sp. BE266]
MTDRHLDERIRTAELGAYLAHGRAVTDRVIEVGDRHQRMQVRVTEATGEGVPVVFLHGIASASVLFAPLVGALPRRRVFVVDWPGHGLSGPIRVDTAPGWLREQAGRILIDVLDVLGVQEVDVVGHSLGAQFGLYAAIDHPDRVRRLVTLGAPGAGLPGTRPVPVMRAMSTPLLGRLALSLPMSDSQFRRASAMALGPGIIERQAPEVYEAARLVAGRRGNATGTASYFRALLRRGRVRPGVALGVDELARIAAPVLLVWGELDVFLTPSEAAASIRALRQHRLVTLQAGHGPWLDDPTLVAEEVSSHLG